MGKTAEEKARIRKRVLEVIKDIKDWRVKLRPPKRGKQPKKR